MCPKKYIGHEDNIRNDQAHDCKRSQIFCVTRGGRIVLRNVIHNLLESCIQGFDSQKTMLITVKMRWFCIEVPVIINNRVTAT